MSITRDLAAQQHRDIEDFLSLFSDAEKALKRRLGLPTTDKTSLFGMVTQYTTLNPQWAESADQLRCLADIRNLLTHQRGLVSGYPIAITPDSLNSLRQIVYDLLHPDPVSEGYKKSVTCVAPGDSLASTLALAYHHGFSQFPVIEGTHFRGLITDNQIVRWLGRTVKAGKRMLDLETVPVMTVVAEKDPDQGTLCIFTFAKLSDPVGEVMGKFAVHRALEVVLLSSSGTGNTPLEGIVTQWDAARYPAIPKPRSSKESPRSSAANPKHS
jgi:CBS domain-containing protein